MQWFAALWTEVMGSVAARPHGLCTLQVVDTKMVAKEINAAVTAMMHMCNMSMQRAFEFPPTQLTVNQAAHSMLIK
jgi:hypothetical protein